MLNIRQIGIAGALFAAALTFQGPVSAQSLAMAEPGSRYPASIFDRVMPRYEALPSQADGAVESPAHLRRQIVSYSTREPAGTIMVDTANTYLYYVLGGGRAMRYGIGVGREGFTWSGTERVGRKAEWPDWHPPADMIARQPYLPRFMAGGEGNPLGARALYLGNTIYRIHGTNKPSSIGSRMSSGCIRMLNEDVTDLYERVNVGTKVVVLPSNGAPNFADRSPASEPAAFYERQSRRTDRNEASAASRGYSRSSIY